VRLFPPRYGTAILKDITARNGKEGHEIPWLFVHSTHLAELWEVELDPRRFELCRVPVRQRAIGVSSLKECNVCRVGHMVFDCVLEHRFGEADSHGRGEIPLARRWLVRVVNQHRRSWLV